MSYWLNVQKCPNDVLLKELWRRMRSLWPTGAKYTSNYSELQLIVGHIPHLTLHPWTLNIVLAKCCAFHNIYRSHGTCSHVGRFVERGNATRFTIANSLNVKTVFLAWSQIQGTHLVCFKAWDNCSCLSSENLDWNSAYLLALRCTKSTKLIEFHFKFLHRRQCTIFRKL